MPERYQKSFNLPVTQSDDYKKFCADVNDLCRRIDEECAEGERETGNPIFPLLCALHASAVHPNLLRKLRRTLNHPHCRLHTMETLENATTDGP